MVFRLILPDWAKEETPSLKKVLEGEFDDSRLQDLNRCGYNVYWLPNHPSTYNPQKTVDGSDIDVFTQVFVDLDIKDGQYADKDSFIEALGSFPLKPSRIVDSGNGIHAYWEVSDLDAMSFLRLQRRLMRYFNTDPAVAKIYQLMRYPNTVNTKDPDNLKLCEILIEESITYTCEELDIALPTLLPEDAVYCQTHYDKTYQIRSDIQIDDKIPLKFLKLIRDSKEAKEIWSGNVEDRSTADYRLGHIMLASGFTQDEALSVLVNSAKALSRAPIHRISYAQNIVDKVWAFEEKTGLDLSSSVAEIFQKGEDVLEGKRFPCWQYLDNTESGFRLGQVIGLVAGSGVGKTAMALNMFEGFVTLNPDYQHFFIPLEQPAREIADRWRSMCRDRSDLYDKVHVISNYAEDGSFRHLSFDDIKEYILKFQSVTNKKIGCIVLDHIGALKKKGKNGENQDLMEICHQMKAFAIHTNTLLVMQSQAPREKAGIGDLELDKDAAYGTVYFESYCDYLVTIWQPLKRCYKEEGCPFVTAFKFCKIRHKKANKDVVKEDVRYLLWFEPDTGHFRELTQKEEEEMIPWWVSRSTNLRKQDRKTDLVPYTSTRWESSNNGK